eukprot:753012-Hanusia_phi.AAC.5
MVMWRYDERACWRLIRAVVPDARQTLLQASVLLALTFRLPFSPPLLSFFHPLLHPQAAILSVSSTGFSGEGPRSDVHPPLKLKCMEK